MNNGVNDLALQDSCPLEGLDRQWLFKRLISLGQPEQRLAVYTVTSQAVCSLRYLSWTTDLQSTVAVFNTVMM